MKKVLVSLLVLALAMTSVFAGIDFSGKFVAGYTFNTTDWKNWTSQAYGEDKNNSNPLKLDASIADENGLWSITMKGVLQADDRLAGTATVDLGKVFMGADSDVSIALALVANNRVAGLNAYNNASGFNMTRIRTLDKGLWTSLTIGYTDLVQFQIGGAPRSGAGNAFKINADINLHVKILLSQYLKFVNISPNIFLMFYIIIHKWME